MKGDKYTAWLLPGLTLIGLSVTYIASKFYPDPTHEITIVNPSEKQIINLSLKICNETQTVSVGPKQETAAYFHTDCKSDVEFFMNKQRVGSCRYLAGENVKFSVKFTTLPIVETNCYQY